jgi:hypothetical protein
MTRDEQFRHIKAEIILPFDCLISQHQHSASNPTNITHYLTLPYHNTFLTSLNMKVSILAVAALLGLASAQKAVVVNGCSTAVYVQSYPYSGGSGTLTTVQPGKSFSENFRSSGSTVKVAKTKTLDKPLFFGYSFSKNPDYAYCKPSHAHPANEKTFGVTQRTSPR